MSERESEAEVESESIPGPKWSMLAEIHMQSIFDNLRHAGPLCINAFPMELVLVVPILWPMNSIFIPFCVHGRSGRYACGIPISFFRL